MNFHTGPSLAPVTFAVGDLAVTKVSVGEMDNNAYLIAPPRGQVVLIDAAADLDRLMQVIADRDLGMVVTTHQHHDHIGALARILAVTGARGFCGTPDVGGIAEQTGVGLNGVWDGETLICGAIRLEVIGLVGHTPGSIALVLRPPHNPVHLFVGDCLFPGGVGKTWSADDFTSLLFDVEKKIFDCFPDDTIIHPGHGDATTLGAERESLPQWRERGW
ncbi:hypothetical protein HMPREF1531_01959 [Propionibacterium sp. oral taxon 192 str. F0372]|uniref:MBL fold metallo-hydrolase n=1 Tax=Propionibacterium sp. oral taxon 192 TaxID=671222 RepID=UPI0003548AB3|nr:MBL fold metallo-hydrolase [Propionibacterium sp. oral taxon 192]EPH02650.1 hypothetical protein HMPREF1531_01959 [Propionibacterium sp. oral taxon 192 str. F0372]